MKKIKLILLLFLFSGTAMLTSSFRIQENDWTLVSSNSGIEVFAKPITCSSQGWVAFKFENTTTETQQFKYEIKEPENPTHGGINGVLTMKSNASVMGSCETQWELTMPLNKNEKVSLEERLSISITTNKNNQ